MTPVRPAQRSPGGFRRRLTLAFVAVAALSAGSLAVGVSIAVTSYRTHSFEQHARTDTSRAMALLDPAEPGRSYMQQLQRWEQPGGPDILVVDRATGSVDASVERLGLQSVPRRVRAGVAGRAAEGELVEGTARIGGVSFFVLGVRASGNVDSYFFFSREDLLRGLAELRVTMLISWVVVLAAAAVVGSLVSRQALRPVQAAADAARSVTEGLLDTRLAVSGDDEFGQWADSFNEMVAALEDKIQALERARDREQRFNADIAHELRTPLGALVTAATLLEAQQESFPPELHRPVELVVAGARRLHRLADELLELHRLEAGQEESEQDEIDLTDAVRSALDAHGWADEVRLLVEARPVVLSDRRRIDRIVANLVGNALDHGGGADVVVTVAARDGAATLAVADRGPGIAPEHLGHVFDRYFKVSRSRSNPASATGSTGGSGLGLAIVAEQARLLGGHVTVASVVGEGSTFTLLLPHEASGAPPS